MMTIGLPLIFSAKVASVKPAEPACFASPVAMGRLADCQANIPPVKLTIDLNPISCSIPAAEADLAPERQ